MLIVQQCFSLLSPYFGLVKVGMAFVSVFCVLAFAFVFAVAFVLVHVYNLYYLVSCSLSYLFVLFFVLCIFCLSLYSLLFTLYPFHP